MLVLIVCQAGVGVGLGHLSRSLVIAKALRAQFEADVRWLIQGAPLMLKELKAFEHQFIALDHDLTAAIVKEGSADLVVLDLQPQRVPTDLSSAIKMLRNVGTKVVAVDGLLALRPLLDLIFIPSFHFKPPDRLEEGAPIVFGWDCFLLNVQYQSSHSAPGRRVLVLTGGSDATQLGKAWPALLNQQLPSNVVLEWVTGPFSAKPEWPQMTRIQMVEHVAPQGLGALMQQADYAITVYGVSFFELLYYGVPTVVFSPYNGKELDELKAIDEAGVAMVAADEREATDLLVDLLRRDDLAGQLSKRSRAVLGMPGAQRLCSEIADLMA